MLYQALLDEFHLVVVIMDRISVLMKILSLATPPPPSPSYYRYVVGYCMVVVHISLYYFYKHISKLIAIGFEISTLKETPQEN